MTTPRAFIFDVFGTLVDWRTSVAGTLEDAFTAKGIAADPVEMAVAWRAEYDPSMAPIREGKRGYTALDILHRENLETVLRRADLLDRFDESELTELTTAWERLDPWPDTVTGLKELRKVGFIAPCSNGSVGLMVRLARYAGFPWDCILGAEVGQNYKPHPSVYLASCAALRLDPSEVMMVACHNNDLEAAREAGLQTGFFPRPMEHGDPAKADLKPSQDFDIIAKDVPDLARQIRG